MIIKFIIYQKNSGLITARSTTIPTNDYLTECQISISEFTIKGINWDNVDYDISQEGVELDSEKDYIYNAQTGDIDEIQ